MRLFSRDRKSLQFPANCDGYLQVPYSSSAEQQVGLFGHSGSFTFETIITPYDVNGNSFTAFSGTIKSLGQGAKGLDYLADANRKDVEMVLFYNANMKVFLENTTTTTKNQPAEYAIKFSLTIGSTTTTISSSTVISSTILDESSLDPTNYRYDNHTPTFKKINTTVSSVLSNSIVVSDSSVFFEGQTVYTHLGTIAGVVPVGGIISGGVSFVGTGGFTNTPTASEGVWKKIDKDPLYVNKAHHIAVSYNSSGGRMNIFYDGVLVAEGVHGVGGKFSLASSDINIGQQSDASSQSDKRKSQFMGEMHEMVFLNKYKDRIGTIETLNPFFGDILLYYDFEEANLDG